MDSVATPRGFCGSGHRDARPLLALLLAIFIITAIHVYLGFLWAVGLCFFSLCCWASGPWITHDEYLIRYNPEEYCRKRFTNPDGTKRKPFYESGLGEKFGDARALGGGLLSVLDMSKQAALAEAASRTV